MSVAAWMIWLTVAAAADIRNKRIPDGVIAAGMAPAVLELYAGGSAGLGQRMLGMCLPLLLFFVILLLAPGAFGGGDIKLSMINGFYLKPERWLTSFAAAVFLCGIYLLLLHIRGKFDKKAEIAFGPFLCLGAVTAYFMT